MQWVENAATAVATYYGRFPVPRDRVLIVPAERRRRHAGHHLGRRRRISRLHPHPSRPAHHCRSELTEDWMMTHELVHGAFPSQDDDAPLDRRRNRRLRRARRPRPGRLSASRKIWSDMVRDMPKGNPQPGDQGLDHTHTWGRTYWGGAQFCLLADVTIREQTHNRKGLQDALRAIVAAGGTIDQDWPIRKAFAGRRRRHRNPRPRRSVRPHGQRARHRRP